MAAAQGQSKDSGGPGDPIRQAQKVREGYCMMLNSAQAGWRDRRALRGSATFYPEEERLTVASWQLPTAEAVARSQGG